MPDDGVDLDQWTADGVITVTVAGGTVTDLRITDKGREVSMTSRR